MTSPSLDGDGDDNNGVPIHTLVRAMCEWMFVVGASPPERSNSSHVFGARGVVTLHKRLGGRS